MSLEEQRAIRYEWQTLFSTPGWKRLEQLAKDQVAHRTADLCGNPELRDRVVNFMRGEISGIELFRRIPEIELERLKSEIDERAKKLEVKESFDENELDLNGQQIAP